VAAASGGAWTLFRSGRYSLIAIRYSLAQRYSLI
jgi:hypothetical protein